MKAITLFFFLRRLVGFWQTCIWRLSVSGGSPNWFECECLRTYNSNFDWVWVFNVRTFFNIRFTRLSVSDFGLLMIEWSGQKYFYSMSDTFLPVFFAVFTCELGLFWSFWSNFFNISWKSIFTFWVHFDPNWVWVVDQNWDWVMSAIVRFCRSGLPNPTLVAPHFNRVPLFRGQAPKPGYHCWPTSSIECDRCLYRVKIDTKYS